MDRGLDLFMAVHKDLVQAKVHCWHCVAAAGDVLSGTCA